MPVILEQNAWPLWLGEIEGDVQALLRPAAEDVLTFWRID
jgi:putative SOS response-associated peptidase YedK